MITEQDLIRLPHTQDLTQAGVEIACQYLVFSNSSGTDRGISTLRRIVVDVAAELAFRRCLGERQVPYTVSKNPILDWPNHFLVSLGRRFCKIQTRLISQRGKIEHIRHDPSFLLGEAALVSKDQMDQAGLGEEDLYIFSATTGLITQTSSDLTRAISAGQSACLMHTMHSLWASPLAGRAIHPLTFTLMSNEPAELQIGGRGENGDLLTETICLKDAQPVQSQKEYFSLAYIRLHQSTPRTLTIHSPVMERPYQIGDYAWSNLWVYGMEIYLLGYMTRGGFHRSALFLPASHRALRGYNTRQVHLMMQAEELYSLSNLFEGAIQWAREYGHRLLK